MEPQIASTVWLPPGTCLLNSIPAMQMQASSSMTSQDQMTSQMLKHHQQVMTQTVATTNSYSYSHLLPQNQIIQTQPTQNFVHIPALDSLLLPSSGCKQQLYEFPYIQPGIQLDQQLHLPMATAIFPSDISAYQSLAIASTRITKKKRISPSAKRRSRLRLIAFLESKKKQQIEQSSLEENNENQQSVNMTSAASNTAILSQSSTPMTSSSTVS
ncbi:uncharacterized protein LOC120336471 [Styela clava]